MNYNPYVYQFGQYLQNQYTPTVLPERLQYANQLAGRVDVPKGFDASNYQQPVGGNTMSNIGVATDIAGLGMDWLSSAKESLNLGKPQAQYFQEGVDPSYQGGDYFNKVYSSRPSGASGGEILSGTAKGAKVGAQIGGPWGAAIGAAVGGLGSIGAGEVRRARQRREKKKALDMAMGQQQAYNTAQSEYDTQNMNQQEYSRMSNPYRRMQNLYSI